VTDAGMHALWNPSRFTVITDYQTWGDALLDDDDITEHVRAGKLVPINIGGDGAFQFLVGVGTAGQAATLTGREKHHLPASGHPCPDDSAWPECRHHLPHRGGIPGPAQRTPTGNRNPGPCRTSWS
jgi:hypothetical protein